jgi:dihydrofolate reductase
VKVIIIAAISENYALGKNGKLLWHLPNDLKLFKKLTLGKHVLMGRKTFDSIGKPLPDRHNLVMTTNKFFMHEGVIPIHGLDELSNMNLEEIIIIGGEDIYRLFLPYCHKIYLTLVHVVVPGDVFFPEFKNFKVSQRIDHKADEKHAFDYSFIEYERIKNF